MKLFVFIGPSDPSCEIKINCIVAKNIKSARKLLRIKIEEAFNKSPDRNDREFIERRINETARDQRHISIVPCREGSFVELLTNTNPADRFMNPAKVGMVKIPKPKKRKPMWEKVSREEVSRMVE